LNTEVLESLSRTHKAFHEPPFPKQFHEVTRHLHRHMHVTWSCARDASFTCVRLCVALMPEGREFQSMKWQALLTWTQNQLRSNWRVRALWADLVDREPLTTISANSDRDAKLVQKADETCTARRGNTSHQTPIWPSMCASQEDLQKLHLEGFDCTARALILSFDTAHLTARSLLSRDCFY
jgi:hypothetical protein